MLKQLMERGLSTLPVKTIRWGDRCLDTNHPAVSRTFRASRTGCTSHGRIVAQVEGDFAVTTDSEDAESERDETAKVNIETPQV